VAHLFERRGGRWESLCGFYAADRLRGDGPGRPGPAACSLCAMTALGPRAGILAGERILMHARGALRLGEP
jgi:hypothetical protein